METKEWIHVLDRYLITNHMFAWEYEKLDDLQKYVIHELKKSFSRINKSEINEIHHSLKNKNNE